jgi:hypothetical protein
MARVFNEKFLTTLGKAPLTHLVLGCDLFNSKFSLGLKLGHQFLNMVIKNETLCFLEMRQNDMRDHTLRYLQKILKDRQKPLEMILLDNLFSTSGTLTLRKGITIHYSRESPDEEDEEDDDD